MSLGNDFITGSIGDLLSDGSINWGGRVRNLFDLIEQATEGKIGVSSINITDDLTLNGNAVTDVAHVGFTNRTTDTSGNGTVYMKSGELFFRDNLGNVVQLTSDGALNLSAVGGLGGDYATDTSSSLDYDLTNERYIAYSDKANTERAEMEVGQLRIAGRSSGPASFFHLAVGALSASMTGTLPGQPPQVTGDEKAFVLMDRFGRMYAQPEIGNAQLSGTLFGDPTITGAVTISGSISSTEVIETHVPICMGRPESSSLDIEFAGSRWKLDGTNFTAHDLFLPLPFSANTTLHSVRVNFNNNGQAPMRIELNERAFDSLELTSSFAISGTVVDFTHAEFSNIDYMMKPGYEYNARIRTSASLAEASDILILSLGVKHSR